MYNSFRNDIMCNHIHIYLVYLQNAFLNCATFLCFRPRNPLGELAAALLQASGVPQDKFLATLMSSSSSGGGTRRVWVRHAAA